MSYQLIIRVQELEKRVKEQEERLAAVYEWFEKRGSQEVTRKKPGPKPKDARTPA